jgi:hypothetical protein
MKAGEDDPHIYPEVLDKLLEIEFALRVKYQPYYRQASVNAFSRDKVVINKIKAHLHPNKIQPEVQKVNEVRCGCFLCNCAYYFWSIYLFWAYVSLLTVLL